VLPEKKPDPSHEQVYFTNEQGGAESVRPLVDEMIKHGMRTIH
jgi:hypothetical protein